MYLDSAPRGWGAESRWWSRRTQSLCLLKTRPPTRCWWETSTPKGTGGIPKQLGRTWGECGGRRSGGGMGPASLRGDWGRGGVPTPGEAHSPWGDQQGWGENPRGFRGLEGNVASISPANLGPKEPAGVLGLVLCPLRPSLATCGGGRGRVEVNGEGPSGIGGLGKEHG